MNLFTKIGLLSLGLLSRPVAAQIASVALDQDPVFNQVASHRIQYPVKPASMAVYGRFYAGFNIDEKGHIQDLSILYPKLSTRLKKAYGFEYEILKGLKHMPPLKPSLAGSYVLPVAFCYTHYGEGANPIVPTNVVPQTFSVGDRFLLSEVKIFARSPSDSRWLAAVPHSRQIGQ